MYKEKRGYKIVAVCKKTGLIINDYLNKRGLITKHLTRYYPEKIKRLKLTSKIIEKKTNKYWYEEYFEFKYIPQKSKSLDMNDYVICKICNKKLKILNHKHLITHNITVNEYKIKYDDNVVSNKTHNKLSKQTKKTNSRNKKQKTSKSENEIKEFLRENDIKIVQSKRNLLNGLEIDLFAIDYNIGIEYNGIIYHSENYGKKNSTYHLNKTEIALKNNIKLIHIFEDEWYHHKDIVKYKLLHLFNKNNGKKIHARKCDIRLIDSNLKGEFLNKNHIQGNDNSSISIGAFYNNILCAVMTFDNKRIMNVRKNNNTNIYFFINKYKPNEIISFADRRWTPQIDNNLYTKLGFKCVSILKPDYMYINRKEYRPKRLHKFGFGKSSIKKRFPEIYDVNKTEWEMMKELNYDRIWDCGKFKYSLLL